MTARRPATAASTFRERDAWVRAVLASDLPHVAVRVAVRIALHLHVDSGRCDPTIATLAAGTGLAVRSIYRKVVLLERTGWIAIQRTSGRHSNQYLLLNPDQALTGLNPDQALTGLNRANPVHVDNPTLSSRTTNPDSTVADQKRLKAKRKQKGEESDSAPDFSGWDSSEPLPKKSKKEIGKTFERFWAAYPKHVAESGARKAFAATIKAGVEPALIIAGAKRYAIERRGEPPRYTAHPANWLRDRRWNDPAAADSPPIIDQDGNVVAVERPSSGRQLGVVAVGETLAREFEAKGWDWWKR